MWAMMCQAWGASKGQVQRSCVMRENSEKAVAARGRNLRRRMCAREGPTGEEDSGRSGGSQTKNNNKIETPENTHHQHQTPPHRCIAASSHHCSLAERLEGSLDRLEFSFAFPRTEPVYWIHISGGAVQPMQQVGLDLSYVVDAVYCVCTCMYTSRSPCLYSVVALEAIEPALPFVR